jgi:hypothetical protein
MSGSWDRRPAGKGLLPPTTFTGFSADVVVIYSTRGLEGGVQHQRLLQRTKDYLLSRQYEDEDAAVAAAEELIEW